MNKIYFASDHAGYELKQKIILHFSNSKNLESKANSQLLNGQLISQFEFVDLGPNDSTSVDYPDYANQVCHKLKNDASSFGVLICGSGQGMAMRANKFFHIRAALVYNNEVAALSREHNNANIICLGSRFCTLEQATEWISLFVLQTFAEGRHTARVAKLSLPVT